MHKSSIVTPIAKDCRGQRRCLQTSFGPSTESVIALDVEFVHLRYATTDTWTIVPGEVALVTADGILLHTYIHPGKLCSQSLELPSKSRQLLLCSCGKQAAYFYMFRKQVRLTWSPAWDTRLTAE